MNILNLLNLSIKLWPSAYQDHAGEHRIYSPSSSHPIFTAVAQRPAAKPEDIAQAPTQTFSPQGAV